MTQVPHVRPNRTFRIKLSEQPPAAHVAPGVSLGRPVDSVIVPPVPKFAPLAVAVARPRLNDLAAIDATLVVLYETWPKDSDGRLELAVLKRGQGQGGATLHAAKEAHSVNLGTSVHFSDGLSMPLEHLLAKHRDALDLYRQKMRDQKRAMLRGIPINAQSIDYLLFAIRRATGNDDVETTTYREEPTHTIEVVIPMPGRWRDKPWLNDKFVRDVLRAAWGELRGQDYRIDTYNISEFQIGLPTGETIRLGTLVSRFYTVERARLVAAGAVPADFSKTTRDELALDVIHYQLFGEGRVRPRWDGDNMRTYKLQFPARLPDTDVFYPSKFSAKAPDKFSVAELQDQIRLGFKIARAISRTAFVKREAGVGGTFPYSGTINRRHEALVRFIDSRSGVQIVYDTFLTTLFRMIIEAKHRGLALVEGVIVDSSYLAHPERWYNFPPEATRASLFRVVNPESIPPPPPEPGKIFRRRQGPDGGVTVTNIVGPPIS